MNSIVAVALGALVALVVFATVALVAEARRRPIDDLDETDTFPRMRDALDPR